LKTLKETCVVCGKEIEITHTRYSKSKTKKFTCSVECMGKNNSKPPNCFCSNCGKPMHKKPSHITKTNFCTRKCSGEYRSNNNTGVNNGNKIYIFDESMFKVIDTEFKSWLLGWLASDGCIGKNTITIAIDKRDIDILKTIQKEFCTKIPIVDKNDRIKSYTISSKEIMQDALNLLKLENYGKKADKLTGVDLEDSLFFHFLRGLFEGDGNIKKSRAPECSIASISEEFLLFIGEKVGIPYKINKGSINYYGVNALDFLGKLYDKCKYKMLRKYELYMDICLWEPKLNGKYSYTNKGNSYFAKTREDAVFPFKERVSDSGYDLTLLSLEKRIGEVELYDTGIKVTPPFGYYYDLVPRSSIIKSGYILGNSVGIIDRTYLGAIKVPLIKIDKNAPDLKLPNRLVQIVPREIVHFNFIEVEELQETDRGAGGFGSTGRV